MELVTWIGQSDYEEMGWGNCVAGEDSDDLKRKFEIGFNGIERKMYD